MWTSLSFTLGQEKDIGEHTSEGLSPGIELRSHSANQGKIHHVSTKGRKGSRDTASQSTPFLLTEACPQEEQFYYTLSIWDFTTPTNLVGGKYPMPVFSNLFVSPEREETKQNIEVLCVGHTPGRQSDWHLLTAWYAISPPLHFPPLFP